MRATKNSILAPGDNSRFRSLCRDKIESICSPKICENQLRRSFDSRSPASGGIPKITICRPSSTGNAKFSAKNFRRSPVPREDPSAGMASCEMTMSQKFPQESIEKITEKQPVRTFGTNIFSMFFLAKAAMKHLKQVPRSSTPSCSIIPHPKARLLASPARSPSL